jgi:hypothetical protein
MIRLTSKASFLYSSRPNLSGEILEVMQPQVRPRLGLRLGFERLLLKQ